MIYENIKEGYYWLTINAENNDVKYVVKVYTNRSGVKGIGLGAWDGGGFVSLKHVMEDELNTLTLFFF